MSEPDDLPPHPPRNRRPTKRFEEYGGFILLHFLSCHAGDLTLLLKSVGRAVPPVSIESQVAEQAKKQKAIAAAHGNASQPGPLPPPSKCRKPNDGKPLLNHQYDDITDEEDQLEWLYQVIEQFGDTTNYRDDPEFQDPAVLWEVYEDLSAGNLANQKPTPLPDMSAGAGIRSGMVKAFKHHESGHRAAPKLVRTDRTTIGLDGVPVNTHNRQEIGRPVASKLTRTDDTTLGLDGRPPSPPQTGVVSRRSTQHSPTVSRTTKTSQLPATLAQTPLAGQPTPSWKRALVPHTRVEALRRESNAHNMGPQQPSHGPSRAGPSGDTGMSDPAPTDDEEELEPLPPQIGGHQAPGTLPTGVCNDGNGGDGNNSDNSDDNGDNSDTGDNGDDDELGTSKSRLQLQAFGAASGILEKVVYTMRVEMAVVCGYPEFVKSTEDPSCSYLDVWLPKFWADANNELRPDKPRLPLKDSHVRYARRQLAPIRNVLKKCCEPMLGSYYSLDRSEPDHAQTANNLTSDEKWLSP
ncbi:hypothetical protein FRC10_005078, partial [Ceratobasidium sp. 414]